MAVEVEGATPGWADGVPGTRATDDADVYALDDDGDEQLLLDAARRAGRVMRFAPAERSLAELFHRAVS